MNAPASLPRILLIDSNVYFAKRLGDALKQQGFDVIPSTQAAYALTMLEWNAPAAILCATNYAKWARSKWRRSSAPIPRPPRFR